MKNKLTLILLLVLSVSLFATVSESKDINLSLALEIPDSISIKVTDYQDIDLNNVVSLEHQDASQLEPESYAKHFILQVNTLTSKNVGIYLKTTGPLSIDGYDDSIDFELRHYMSQTSETVLDRMFGKGNYDMEYLYHRTNANGVITEESYQGWFSVVAKRDDVLNKEGGVYQTKLIVEMKTIE